MLSKVLLGRLRIKTSTIFVLISLGAPAQSHYWDDPVNIAVMAWEEGIVVVASVGIAVQISLLSVTGQCTVYHYGWRGFRQLHTKRYER